MDESFWDVALQIQELKTSIKMIQARIRFLRKNILNNHNVKVKIELAKQKINTLLQLEDDWLTIEYSGYNYVCNRINR